ncbi:MAG: hypothetical protein P794_00855 [Epsilonproteobacteria bacterium (ex Lamellibrachia satsuma)]|nr:MAG: hypothetical protein P794_00855 [Epsilonproteobacteria bacterium (ex Lamellibrachia satsuma)]
MQGLKKILSSVLLLSFICTFAVPDEDINLKEAPKITVQKSTVKLSSTYFYTGLGYSYLNMDSDSSNTDTGHAITLLAGYNFHKYLALESRYTATINDSSVHNTSADFDQRLDISNIALYLKPKYSTGGLTMYGLLGYGQITFDNGISHSENSFQCAIGAQMEAIYNIDVFVDYTKLYDDNDFDISTNNSDLSIDAVNIGVKYNF